MIVSLLKDGYTLLQTEREQEESLKLGIFRAGNSGYVKNDQPFSSCPRLAYLRYMGQNNGIAFEEHLSVTTGVLHEKHITDLLIASPHVKTIEVWEDVPQVSEKIVQHAKAQELIIDGFKVSGRPDRVITLDTGERIGLELKSVIAASSAFKISQGFPSTQYVAQVLVYQEALQIPFRFLFGQYFIAEKFAGKTVKKVLPGVLEFEVETVTESQTKIYRLAPDGTKEDVKYYDFGIKEVRDFYRMCQETATGDSLPVRPIWETYDKCNYCSHKENCDSYDHGVVTKEEWKNLCS